MAVEYVSDCCLGDYKLKTFYNFDGTEAVNIVLSPGEKEAICLVCKIQCSIIRKPVN